MQIALKKVINKHFILLKAHEVCQVNIEEFLLLSFSINSFEIISEDMCTCRIQKEVSDHLPHYSLGRNPGLCGNRMGMRYYLVSSSPVTSVNDDANRHSVAWVSFMLTLRPISIYTYKGEKTVTPYLLAVTNNSYHI